MDINLSHSSTHLVLPVSILLSMDIIVKKAFSLAAAVPVALKEHHGIIKIFNLLKVKNLK
jgi:hypothetical protein